MPKNHARCQKGKENFVVACLRPSENVKLSILTSYWCSDGKEIYKKSMMHAR